MGRLGKMKLFLIAAFVGITFVLADSGNYMTGPNFNLKFS